MKARLLSLKNNEEFSQYIFNKLTQQKTYIASYDEKLSCFNKRKIHDTLMELVAQGLLYYSIEIEDDAFWLKKNITLLQIQDALIIVDNFLSDTDQF